MSITVNFELKKLFNIHISQNNIRLFITRNFFEQLQGKAIGIGPLRLIMLVIIIEKTIEFKETCQIYMKCNRH